MPAKKGSGEPSELDIKSAVANYICDEIERTGESQGPHLFEMEDAFGKREVLSALRRLEADGVVLTGSADVSSNRQEAVYRLASPLDAEERMKYLEAENRLHAVLQNHAVKESEGAPYSLIRRKFSGRQAAYAALALAEGVASGKILYTCDRESAADVNSPQVKFFFHKDVDPSSFRHPPH